jgi:hypothetical protein|uniref:Uncharacterized protein n=1 Tax=Oryza sativa subsp. japonica TaxID=39947 RepID=Q5Z7S2_ORYSJ|nr:hypothetical protein [Oryza sativa Japonica Group]BAD61784.1 hypothetical protein [Oryza sativa Japonica Group]
MGEQSRTERQPVAQNARACVRSCALQITPVFLSAPLYYREQIVVCKKGEERDLGSGGRSDHHCEAIFCYSYPG